MRCHWIACLALLSVTPAARPEGFTFPPKASGDTAALLTVTVAEPDVSAPNRVRYEIRVRTSAAVDVEEPALDKTDARAWKSKVSKVVLRESDGGVTWNYRLDLEQIKTDREPLPAVSVRFHTRDRDDWTELEWNDDLKTLRQLPLPEVQPPTPQLPQRSWVWWGAGLGALLCLALGITLWSLRRKKPPPPLSPAESAIRELDRIEGLGVAGPDEGGWFPEEVSGVIRRFLSERYGLPAQVQTTAEFLHTMSNTPELPEELQMSVKELLERCDLAKFAAMRTPPDECRRIVALARAVVQQTMKKAEPRPEGSGVA
jgi:hypothetical protein